jgi:hypothetical protein
MAINLRAMLVAGSVLILAHAAALAQQTFETKSIEAKAPASSINRTSDNTPANVLSPEDWQRVDAAVSRALEWLATQQQPDGSFRTIDNGQPGVTCLCMMAFISHGHVPGD